MTDIISLSALLLAIFIGIIRPKVNIGVVSIVFALIIGILILGIKEKEVTSLFPSNLFLMLVGITLFFGIASTNGSLSKLTDSLISRVGGKTKLLPISIFVLTFVLSAIGPGNIAATLLIAPVAMQLSAKSKISPLLMAIMVATGANAGAFSPVAPTGVVSTGLIQKIGVMDIDLPLKIFIGTAIIQSLSAMLAYVAFKGYLSSKSIDIVHKVEKFTRKDKITVFSILLLVFSVIVLKLPITVVAFGLAIVLLIFNVGDSEKTIKQIPWDAILLVTGVTVLIGVMEKGGGLDLATDLIAKIASVDNINGILSITTGVISAYSSSSGVVMPAFIPLIPSIIEKIGGGNITEMLIAVNVGSHMVDVSPLSTLGAICIATAQIDQVEKGKLFRNLMIWGLAMAVFGSLVIYVLLDLL
ncbi:MAG TPA: SLC13 family permease [Candidatus Dojkabacteria bacterium]|nr:SLC13 family permease [Candidatus Dojkabacteria bacterium]HRP51062.1 SLC13 family permease [Candidatus Dojkabacteria bacterium]